MGFAPLVLHPHSPIDQAMTTSVKVKISCGCNCRKQDCSLTFYILMRWILVLSCLWLQIINHKIGSMHHVIFLEWLVEPRQDLSTHCGMHNHVDVVQGLKTNEVALPMTMVSWWPIFGKTESWIMPLVSRNRFWISWILKMAILFPKGDASFWWLYV